MKKKSKQKWAKFLTVELSLGMAFTSIFSFPIPVKAAESYVGRITGNDVRLRSKPTTVKVNGVSNIILEMDEGTIVTVLSMTKTPGKKGDCDAGWYQANYQGHTGYICSTYVSVNGYDQYDRPWTTPKKAIVGGAKFIASSYIAKGQFTSYLKKFNVNPNAYHDVYNHLYMSNLAAPSSEAKSSWKTYSSNGLSELPLAFSIPIFNNMGEAYNRPGGNLVNVDKQGNVTDQAFEEELNRQGFPESYKTALRFLHSKHPNWTFTAMHTGLDFSTSVLAFKNVGAIQGGNQYYEIVNGSPIQAGNDKGWYIPNDATTAYYLDPRNFLTESYILQFESLEYSANYSESVVQGVINNTFMAGISVLDNQAYSSIFVEAGKTANVSAVYLASLARQESGVNGGYATTGNAFEYEGVKYSGLFNFFNIGAKSSASSPVKAGLVYASGGVCTTCAPGTDLSVPVLTLASYVTSAGYKINNGYINGFSIGEAVSTIKGKLANPSIGVNTNSSVIGTGTTFTYNGETYTAVVYGDLTGDGGIDVVDLLKMRQHLLGTKPLSGAYQEAANVNRGDGIVDVVDLLKLRQHLLGTNQISQS